MQANEIRENMKMLGLTKNDVAKLADVNPRTVDKWISRQRTARLSRYAEMLLDQVFRTKRRELRDYLDRFDLAGQ